MIFAASGLVYFRARPEAIWPLAKYEIELIQRRKSNTGPRSAEPCTCSQPFSRSPSSSSPPDCAAAACSSIPATTNIQARPPITRMTKKTAVADTRMTAPRIPAPSLSGRRRHPESPPHHRTTGLTQRQAPAFPRRSMQPHPTLPQRGSSNRRPIRMQLPTSNAAFLF